MGKWKEGVVECGMVAAVVCSGIIVRRDSHGVLKSERLL